MYSHRLFFDTQDEAIEAQDIVEDNLLNVLVETPYLSKTETNWEISFQTIGKLADREMHYLLQETGTANYSFNAEAL